MIHLPLTLRLKLGLFFPWRLPYGRAIGFGWRRRKWLLTSPEDVRHVLTVRSDNYVKSEHLVSEHGRNRVGRGLLTAAGDRHHALRRLLWPAFRPNEIAAHYGLLISQRVQQALEQWVASPSIDLFQATADLIRSILWSVLFGPDFCDCEFDRAARIRRRYNEYFYSSPLPGRQHWPFPVVWQHRQALATIRFTLKREMARVGQQGSSHPCYLDYLFKARFPDGRPLSETEVYDELLPLTTTGYETAGDGLAWMLLQMARFPEVFHRLQAEVDEQVGSRQPQASDLARLGFADSVQLEVLRLFPPAWTYVRVPLSADRLPTGAAISQSDLLFLCPYVLHRHPEFFPQPQHFLPQRFAPEVDRRPLQFVYFPFGIGAHRCIGEHLARLEMLLALVMVARHCNLELLAGHRVSPVPGLTLRASGPVRVRLRWRKP